MARTPTTHDPFNAVAEPKRRQVLAVMGTEELSVNEIVERLGWNQPMVSKHLGVLKQVGLVSERRAGRQRMYQVNAERLKPIFDWVTPFEKIWNDRFDRLTTFYKTCKKRRSNMSSKNKTTITAKPGKQELFITREFDAPRELVFKAHTNPKLFVQWIGPHGLTTNLETFEPVNGGKWRFIQKDKDNNEFGFHGVFHEVSLERVIQTFEFDGLPESGHVTLETMTLEALPNGRTKLMTHSVFQTVSDRDGLIQAGMERGVNEGYERLDEILAK